MPKNVEKVSSKTTVEKDYYVVGIGSSAGGLEALQDLVKNIPTGLPLVIMIAQHLSPQHKSMLAELLGRNTVLPVLVAKNNTIVEQGNIYVCPPNADMTIENNIIRLVPPSSSIGPRPSADALLASIATSYGEKAVGVVLSGTGSDGAYGMRTIQAAGGLTIAQDPNTAKYSAMPRASIEAGVVDRIVSTDEIGKLFKSLLSGDLDRISENDRMPETIVKRILSALYSQTGVDYSSYKMSTILRQIARRMAILQIEDQNDYLNFILSERGEAKSLGQSMLVSVTSFYRDPDAWDVFSELLSQKFKKSKNIEQLRVWVAGCATGEEAYTLAMVVGRALGYPVDLSSRLKIFATDLDDVALEIGRRGIYPAASGDFIPTELRKKYTEEAGSNIIMKSELKDCVVFARHNLAIDPPFLRTDIISCRNLLIYFEQDLQETVLQTLHFSLKPEGTLFLGASENISTMGKEFTIVDAKNRLYKRGKKSLGARNKTIPKAKVRNGSKIVSRSPSNRADESQMLRDTLLQTLAPPSLLVSDNDTVIQVLGDVSSYCHFPEGNMDMSVYSLVEIKFLPEVRRLVSRVRKTGETAKGIPIKIKEKDSSYVEVTVHAAENMLGSFLIVSFVEKEDVDNLVSPAASNADPAFLQAELDNTREVLQSTVEELETSNEELQSMNEEMMASTEELQASNEELETINEELQASNEELGTLNEELQVRTRELADANLDLRNIQESISQAIILVDKDTVITRYSPLAVRLFALVEDDIGTRLDRVATTIPLPDLNTMLNRVIETGKSEVIIADSETADYQIVISARHGEKNEISGAVLSINNITHMRASRQAVEQTGEDLVLISSQLGVAAWSRKRKDGRLVSIGSESLKLLGVPPEALLDNEDTWLQNVLPEDKKIAKLCRDPNRPIRLQYRTLCENQIRTLVDIVHKTPDDSSEETVGTIRDITDAARVLLNSNDSNATVDAVFEMPGQLTIIAYSTGEILRCGSNAEEYFGVAPEILVGRRIVDLCISSDRARLLEWLLESSKENETSIEIGSVDRDGRLRTLELHATRIFLSQGPELLITVRNVTAERAESEILRLKNSVDSLTNLTSRSEFTKVLKSSIRKAEKNNSALALLWLDLDNFKDINDRYGHAAGDDVLAEVSSRLKNSVRGFDVLARVGGDEFCMIVSDTHQLDQLDFISERMLHSLRSPLEVGNATCHVSGSIGIALYPNDAENVEELLLAADTAMYSAKAEGGDRFKFHLAGMHAQAEERAKQRHELAEAIREEIFVMRYQPILDISKNELFAAEALVRKQLPNGDLQTAGAFIEIAEHSGQIRQLGRLVLKLIGADIIDNAPLDIPIAVNMSPAELNDPSLPTFLRQTELLRLVPNLIIEVTEHLLLEQRSVGMQTLNLLHSMGARIWIDDYGSGFSNMKTLEQLDPEVLKIDKTFTDQAARGDARGLAFLESARMLGESLGCKVLAEGIETEKHLEAVKKTGITLVQGFLIGYPMEISELMSWKPE